MVPYEELVDEKAKSSFQVCKVCLKPADKFCKDCQVVAYCTVECQKKDFQLHSKKICPIF